MATTQSVTNSANDVFAGLGLGRTSAAGQSNTEAMQDRFLTLLISQMKNQDPLNPMDNAQMTSQLAQINTVSGIEKLNGTLEQLVSFYDEGRAMQAASMVGKNVLVAGNNMMLAEGKAFGAIDLADKADKVTVTIKDANGLVMRSMDLGEHAAGSAVFVWDGKTDAGTTAVEGRYTFTVEAVSGEDRVGSEALQLGTVSAVVRDKSGFSLDLGSLGEASFDDVRRIL